MKVINITGDIYNGMWNYEAPFPKLDIKPLPEVPWVKSRVYCEIFEGMHSQTGTYLETPAHFLGDESYNLCDVPLDRLVDIECVILKPELKGRAITAENISKANGFSEIRENDAVLICCDWGRHWRDKNFLCDSPYFTREAMELLISIKPFLLGSDFPRWENIEKPEGFFQDFYNGGILMLAPCVNLEKCKKTRVLLTALPLNIEGTSCAPCRAFIKE